MADAVTASGSARQLPMRCAECRGEFHGTAHNVIEYQRLGDRTVMLTMCDNCLRDIGRLARG